METESKVKVGDTLFERVGWSGEPRIVGVVTKITPTGRITCGGEKYTDNLKRVGSTGWHAVYAEVLTPEVEQEIAERKRRNKALKVLLEQKWKDLSTDTLVAVAEVLKAELEKEKARAEE